MHEPNWKIHRDAGAVQYFGPEVALIVLLMGNNFFFDVVIFAFTDLMILLIVIDEFNQLNTLYDIKEGLTSYLQQNIKI